MVITKTQVKNQIGENAYRQLKERLSYSDLKLYATSRYRFMKERILGEKREEEQSLASVIGDICHVMLSGVEGEFDRKFCISQVAEPTGQMLELVQALYRVDQRYRDSEGKQSQQFENLFKEAVDSVKYDRDLKEVMFKGKNMEKILELFTAPDKNGACGELYYKELLANTGKTVVSINNIQTAEKVVEQIKNHPYTSEIANKVTGDHYEVFNELVILYKMDEIEYRSMLDKVIVNHDAKVIMSYDWKITWNNEEGFPYTYMKNMYHLQAALYHYALNEWKVEHGLDDYKVSPMIYIACDVTATASPVIYRLTDTDILKGVNGYKVGNRTYPGVNEIHHSIQWNLQTGNWTTSRELQMTNGVTELGLNYEV